MLPISSSTATSRYGLSAPLPLINTFFAFSGTCKITFENVCMETHSLCPKSLLFSSTNAYAHLSLLPPQAPLNLISFSPLSSYDKAVYCEATVQTDLLFIPY